MIIILLIFFVVLASRHIWLFGPATSDPEAVRNFKICYSETELESCQQVSRKCYLVKTIMVAMVAKKLECVNLPLCSVG